MNEGPFLTQPSQEVEQRFTGKLLNLVRRDTERRKVRMIESASTDPFDRELHGKKFHDASEEMESCAPIRKEIAESFGVTLDGEHTVFYPQKGEGKDIGTQRAFRAFVVFEDAVLGESFYGEGRTMHNLLLTRIIEKFKILSGDTRSSEEILDQIANTDGEFIFIKGFLSDDKFADMSEQNRHLLETPIHTEDGGIIETPKNWFVTGHNLPE